MSEEDSFFIKNNIPIPFSREYLLQIIETVETSWVDENVTKKNIRINKLIDQGNLIGNIESEEILTEELLLIKETEGVKHSAPIIQALTANPQSLPNSCYTFSIMGKCDGYYVAAGNNNLHKLPKEIVTTRVILQEVKSIIEVAKLLDEHTEDLVMLIEMISNISLKEGSQHLKEIKFVEEFLKNHWSGEYSSIKAKLEDIENYLKIKEEKEI